MVCEYGPRSCFHASLEFSTPVLRASFFTSVWKLSDTTIAETFELLVLLEDNMFVKGITKEGSKDLRVFVIQKLKVRHIIFRTLLAVLCSFFALTKTASSFCHVRHFF